MAWAPSYLTASELRSVFVREMDDTNDDTALDLAIAAASRAVDKFCNRQFGLVDAPEQRLYTAQWDRGRGRWVVFHADLMVVTGFAIQTDDGTIDAYDRKPANASLVGMPYTYLVIDDSSTTLPQGTEDEIQITARWGWSSVPDPVKQATALQALRFFKRKGAPFGIAGSPDLGTDLRLLAKIDPDAAAILTPYRRMRAVG